jgi:hypothetical protein
MIIVLVVESYVSQDLGPMSLTDLNLRFLYQQDASTPPDVGH